MTNFIILPDSPSNSISEKDIEKGVFRITVNSKHLFHQCSNKVIVEIKGLRFEATYKVREGRSDTLSIGKIAMSNLNIKTGNSIRITKTSNGNYKIEKI
jgi:hypothetical protein